MEDESSNEKLSSEVEIAYNRIKGHVRKTPLEESAYFAEKTGANVFLKLESEQISGAFKARGAFNKVLKMSSSPSLREKKLFTASSGNHGLALTLALKETGMKGVIYVPIAVAKSKEEMLLVHKAELRKHGDDCLDTEVEAQRAAEREGGFYVSPYNDIDIIAGQGTIGFEIFQDLKQVDAIFVTVGGGGLMAGISSYAKHISPKTKIIGCSPLNSNAMEQSVQAGKMMDVESEDTLSDGSAGNVDHNTITFPICQRNVDRWVSVTEEQIADAIYMMLDIHHKVIEGAAGVALASFLKVKEEFAGKNVVVVICGSSIGVDKLKRIIDSHLNQQ